MSFAAQSVRNDQRSQDVGRSLVDAVYANHGTYREHLHRIERAGDAAALGLFRLREALTPEGGYRANAREAAKLAALLYQRFAQPLVRVLRRDAPLAVAAGLFAVGFPLGVIALALTVSP